MLGGQSAANTPVTGVGCVHAAHWAIVYPASHKREALLQLPVTWAA